MTEVTVSLLDLQNACIILDVDFTNMLVLLNIAPNRCYWTYSTSTKKYKKGERCREIAKSGNVFCDNHCKSAQRRCDFKIIEKTMVAREIYVPHIGVLYLQRIMGNTGDIDSVRLINGNVEALNKTNLNIENLLYT